MRVYICGIDGYIGWPLACHLVARGHRVAGCDNFFRRKRSGAMSAIEIGSIESRVEAFRARWPEADLSIMQADTTDRDAIFGEVRAFKPDAVLQLAEIPSAPYSMQSCKHCAETQANNIIGSLNLMWAIKHHAPRAQLIKIGSMGEYGTPALPIPEGHALMGVLDDRFSPDGWDEVDGWLLRGQRRKGGGVDRVPFPRQPGSFYHASKVAGSVNLEFACKAWPGFRATDVMQGVVYGIMTEETAEDPRLWTRLDYDECFGTAINRFCCQAIAGHPMTLYGDGHQKRGFLPLVDSLECLRLLIENPPAPGEYRVVNQLASVCDLTELAEIVAEVASSALGIDAEARWYENPRSELEDHEYEVDHEKLAKLGYRPQASMRDAVEDMLRTLELDGDINCQHLVPLIRWDGRAEPVKSITR